MTADERCPRVLVRRPPAFCAHSRVREWSCDGCALAGVEMVEKVHAAARAHAEQCVALTFARLSWDVRDQALILRLRAAHLENTSRDTGEIPFPWVELRAAARQLDELVAL